MKCFRIDFNELLKITLLNKENLIPPREHITRYTSEYILYMVTKGVINLKLNSDKIRLAPGDIFLFDKGDFQTPLDATNCEYNYIHFETDSVVTLELTEEEYKRKIDEKAKECNLADFNGDKVYENCYVLIRQKYTITDKSMLEHLSGIFEKNKLTFESKNPSRRMEISSAVCSLFFRLEEMGSEKRRKAYYTARQIADYIEKNFTLPITGSDIENRFFVNFDYANRIFEENMNCSLIRYRNLVRINHAKNRLSNTDMPLGIIAEQTGFESLQYFSRLFKKYEGITPSAYRKRIRSMETYGDK